MSDEHEHVEHATLDSCTLRYVGIVGAPGYGTMYECAVCGRPWLQIGKRYVDPREQLYELQPEDVI